MASTYVRDAPSVKEEQGDLGAVAGRRPRPFRVLSLDGAGSSVRGGSWLSSSGWLLKRPSGEPLPRGGLPVYGETTTFRPPRHWTRSTR